MKRQICLVGALLVAIAGTASAQDALAVLTKAQAAIGNPRTIQVTEAGMNAFFGQALTAGKEWPRREVTSATLAVNFDQKAAKMELVFKEPVFGGQRQNAEVNGDRAWAVGADGMAAPQLAAAEERQLQIWMTPHGFVRAALAAGNATVRTATVDGKKVSRVTATLMGKFAVVGTIDGDGLVTTVSTVFPNPVLGDMAYAFAYSGYKDFGGVKVPTHVVQTEGGFAVNDFTVQNAEVNVPVDLPVPANVQAAQVPAVKVDSTKVAEGVWFLGGGSHHSVLVEFDRFVAVVEGPLDESRSLAVMAEVKRLVPNKPIRYLVSTHHHFDHSGGLRTYVANGATIVTHASNKAYFEKTFLAAATLVPDAQSKAKKKPVIQPVTDKYVITDGKQSVEVHATMGDGHTDELMVAYVLPARILVEADSYSPGPPMAPPPSPVPPNALVLYDNLQRLKIEPVTVIGIHGRGPVGVDEFKKFVGKN